MTTPALLDCVEILTGPEPTGTVIWMHGLGADGHDFVSIVPELGLDGGAPLRFVFPHAPRRAVTINMGMRMPAWYDILGSGNDIVRREDAAGLRESQAAIEALIARERERGIAPERIVLAGFSQGCALALHTGLRQAKPLAGVIGLSGYLPLATEFATERHPASQHVPVFLAHGTDDPVVVLARAEASNDLLLSLGYTVDWHTYPMAHSVHPDEIRDIGAFLRRVLPA